MREKLSLTQRRSITLNLNSYPSTKRTMLFFAIQTPVNGLRFLLLKAEKNLDLPATAILKL